MEIVLKCMRKHSVLGFLVTCLQVSSSKQHLLKKITYNDRIDGIGSDSFCCCLLTLNVFIFFVLMTYDLLVETADTSILEWFCSAAAVGLEAVRQSTRQPLTYDQFMDFRRKTEANRHGWFQPKAKKKAASACVCKSTESLWCILHSMLRICTYSLRVVLPYMGPSYTSHTVHLSDHSVWYLH